jgi:single-strand DNA-binding protein
MGVATNRAWTDKQGTKQEAVEFHSIVFWGRSAEIANEFLVKGSAVLIEGRLETRSWTDKQNVKHQRTEIICENLQLGQRPATAEPRPASPQRPAAQPKPQRETRRDDMASGERSMKLLFAEEQEIKPEEIPF